MDRQAEAKKQRNPLGVIFFTAFVNMLGYGILIPIIPLLLADPASEFYLLPAGLTVAQGYIIMGFLLAIYPIMQFIATPILGQLSDRHGRRRLLAFSLAGTSISYAIFAIGVITKNIPLLFIARAFDGITGGNISIAQAAIADVTAPKDRAKNFGLIGAAFGLGFIIGPFLGGKLSDPAILPWFNAATPFWFGALLALLNTALVLAFLPETLKHRRENPIRLTQSVKNIYRAYTMKEMRVLFFVLFLFWTGFTFYTTFFGVYLIYTFDFNQGSIGDYFAYVGLWIAFSQSVITRRASSRYSEEQILRASLLGTGFFILLLLVPSVWWELLLIVPFFAIFNGLSQSNTVGLVSASTDASKQGEILGVSASVQALAQSLPPILSGFIAASIAPNAPAMVAATIIITAGIVFWLFYRPVKPKTEMPSLAARGMEPVTEQEDAGAGSANPDWLGSQSPVLGLGDIT